MRFNTFLLLSMLSIFCSAQLNWQAKSSMPDRGRYAAIAFEIKGKLYCGLGTTGTGAYLNDFWEYDPTVDVWTQKASFPGEGKYAPASFTIAEKGYVCMGYRDNFTISSGCYSYNPDTDVWSLIAPFPGQLRYSAECFVINSIAYLACGNGGGRTDYKNDFWSYNAMSNKWQQLPNFPGGNRDNVTAFSIGNYGYVGGGNDGAYTTHKDFWRYNPATNSWAEIASMPEARTVASDFVKNKKAYVGLGQTHQFSQILPGFFEYNPISNSWSSLIQNSPNITLRTGAEAVEMGDEIYLMVGWYGNGVHTSLHQLMPNSNQVGDTVYHYIDTCYNSVDDTLNIYTSGIGTGCSNVLLQLYPNPSATLIYFYANKPECFDGSSLELVDQLGQVLQTHPFITGIIQMDVRGYARALYYVRLKSIDGSTVFSKKIIIH